MWRWALVGVLFLGAVYISAQVLMLFFSIVFYILS